MQDESYSSWIARTEPTDVERSLMEGLSATLWDPPCISVLLVVSDLDEIWTKKSVSSVLDGVYPHVELCVCDNGSSRPHVWEALEGFAASDERVKIHRLQTPAGFAGAHNEALSLATGRFVTVLGDGDELAPEALFGMVELLGDPEADGVFGDEDSVDISDRRSDPVFKPYWSPDLLLSTDYVGRPCVIRKSIVEDLGGFAGGLEGAEEHDLLLRIAEKTERISHLPRILYHRRVYEREQANEEPETRGELRLAVAGALARRGVAAAVAEGPAPGTVRVVRNLSGRPKVSVVALVTVTSFADRLGDLERRSSYPVHEVIPVGVGTASEEGAIGVSPARSANLAAGRTTGEYLLFVRDYGETPSEGWIARLLEQAQRSEVGVVGGRVLDGARRTRSAGSFLDLSKLTGSVPGALTREPSRFLPVVDYPFNPLAASVRCMMIRRSTFESADGFDDEKLPTDLYDLDLSFRLGERGLLGVYVPDAPVVSEMGDRFLLPEAAEVEYVWERWWSVLVRALQYKGSPLYASPGDLGDDVLSLLSV